MSRSDTGYNKTMNLLALILGIVACALFAVEYIRGKSLVALGLAVLTAAWMAQLLIANGTPITT